MRNVEVKMIDLLDENQKEITRIIDISNISVPNANAPLDFEHNVIGTQQQQRKQLERWIEERGNEQHNTLLELVSWRII